MNVFKTHNYSIPIALMGMLWITILFSFCANPIAPSGGDKDESPPALDSLVSTPNFQTNFEAKELLFAFDEWIVVKNAFQQVVVSPPLSVPLNVKGRGKEVIVTFDSEEILLDSTTYTINFGDAVQDLNEGNKVPNFKFVFSTGPIIDSLLITGQVRDAISGKPAKDVLVMLYDQLKDSLIYTQKPVYFSRTDDEGRFTIENIRQDSFMLRVLQDENLNYLFESDIEKIGFLEDDLFITGFDSVVQNFDLIIFDNQIPFRRTAKVESARGVYKVVFNQHIENQIISVRTTLDEIQRLIELDTLYIWHQTPPTDSAEVFIEMAEKIDTLIINAAVDPSKRKFQTLNMKPWRPASQPLRKPSGPIILHFSNPIQSIDSSFFELVENDSIPFLVSQFEIDAQDSRKIMINANWNEESRYAWVGLPGAFTDIFGQTNDTLTFKMSNPTKKDFGNIIMNVTDLDTAVNYVLQLILKDKVLNTQQISGDSIWNYTFSSMPPGTYSAKIIEDNNKNGKWDTGNYLLRQFPERIFTQEISPLRASWDVTSDVRPGWNKKIVKTIK